VLDGANTDLAQKSPEDATQPDRSCVNDRNAGTAFDRIADQSLNDVGVDGPHSAPTSAAIASPTADKTQGRQTQIALVANE
jgi:hypothetical protein